MSQDKSKLPKTAGPNHASNKPQRGELFTRRSDGTALLTQTLKMFGRVPKGGNS